MAFIHSISGLHGYKNDVNVFDTVHLRNVKDGQLQIHIPEEYVNYFPPDPSELSIKRIHSRHRRFVAPGALWQIRVCSNSRN